MNTKTTAIQADPEMAIAEEAENTTSCKTIIRDSNTNPRDGIASIFASLSFIVGFIIYSSTLKDLADDEKNISEKLLVIQDNEQVYYLSNMIFYIFFGFAQLILAIGLAQSSKVHFPNLAPISQGLGIVWSTLVLAAGMIANIGAEEAIDMLKEDDPEGAASLWKVISTIFSGLGGGNEIVGGFWVLFAGWSYFLGRICDTKVVMIDRITFGICNIAGVAGLLSTVPVLAENAQAVFGVGMIVWYAMMGVLLLCRSARSDD